MKLLIIEDDIFFQHFYSSKLREQHFEVETASDGVEGLEKARVFRPDIILLDMIMPKKDGFQVLEELKTDTILQHIPILVFSTLGNESDIEKAKKLGAIDYINKSFFDFDVLIGKINQIVNPNTK
jgi:two-component system OmpR family response regulator